MKKLMAIGEALIDFIPGNTNCRIAEVKSFSPAVGGAPANVCGAFVKLGGQAQMMTQLGEDPFGDKIMEEFVRDGIGCDYIKRTSKANTALAFVSLKDDGSREFSFYRKPSADMLMEAEDIRREWFEDGFALHFCSVSLGNYPMKDAHKRAIEYALDAGMLISFDPNLRKPLWNDDGALYKTVHEFIGAFLYKLYENGIHSENIHMLTVQDMEEYLAFANRFSGYSVQRPGAIASYPDRQQIQ